MKIGYLLFLVFVFRRVKYGLLDLKSFYSVQCVTRGQDTIFLWLTEFINWIKIDSFRFSDTTKEGWIDFKQLNEGWPWHSCVQWNGDINLFLGMNNTDRVFALSDMIIVELEIGEPFLTKTRRIN